MPRYKVEVTADDGRVVLSQTLAEGSVRCALRLNEKETQNISCGDLFDILRSCYAELRTMFSNQKEFFKLLCSLDIDTVLAYALIAHKMDVHPVNFDCFLNHVGAYVMGDEVDGVHVIRESLDVDAETAEALGDLLKKGKFFGSVRVPVDATELEVYGIVEAELKISMPGLSDEKIKHLCSQITPQILSKSKKRGAQNVAH